MDVALPFVQQITPQPFKKTDVSTNIQIHLHPVFRQASSSIPVQTPIIVYPNGNLNTPCTNLCETKVATHTCPITPKKYGWGMTQQNED